MIFLKLIYVLLAVALLMGAGASAQTKFNSSSQIDYTYGIHGLKNGTAAQDGVTYSQMMAHSGSGLPGTLVVSSDSTKATFSNLTTDHAADSVQINLALEICNASSVWHSVYLPDAKYELSANITWPRTGDTGNLEMFGQGIGKTTLNYSNQVSSNYAIINMDGKTLWTKGTNGMIWNAKIHDFTLSGLSNTKGYGIYLNRTLSSSFKDIQINLVGTGISSNIYLYNSWWNTFDHIVMSYRSGSGTVGYGIDYSGGGSTFSNLELVGGGTLGIQKTALHFRPLSWKNTVLQGEIASSADYGSGYYAIMDEGVANDYQGVYTEYDASNYLTGARRPHFSSCTLYNDMIIDPHCEAPTFTGCIIGAAIRDHCASSKYDFGNTLYGASEVVLSDLIYQTGTTSHNTDATALSGYYLSQSSQYSTSAFYFNMPAASVRGLSSGTYSGTIRLKSSAGTASDAVFACYDITDSAAVMSSSAFTVGTSWAWYGPWTFVVNDNELDGTNGDGDALWIGVQKVSATANTIYVDMLNLTRTGPMTAS